MIGGGGSGLRASLEIAKSGLDVAVISKVFSHKIAHCCCARRYNLCYSKRRSR
ncbi:MAG: FAD-binding protein [Gammaproteobacteria bacterium]